MISLNFLLADQHSSIFIIDFHTFTILRTKPIIYMKNSEDNPHLGAHVEEYPNYEIIWYEWKYDGPPALAKIKDLADFEPIIILYKNDEITCVIVRKAWDYIPYSIQDEKLILPPSIVFEMEYHHPLVKIQKNENEFNKKISSLSPQTDYDVKPIPAKFITSKFRIGEKHPTKWLKPWITAIDPNDYVAEHYSYYAQDT